MANTWTAYFNGIALAATKNMAGILNGGARVLRIRRVGFINAQSAAVTGVACYGELRWYPASATYGSSTSVTPTAHDSANSGLSSVTIGHNGTAGGTSPVTLRRYFWSSDEAKLTTLTNNELEAFIPLNIVWDAGYGDSNVQPLTLKTGELFTVYNTTGAAGLLDVWIEFTDEAS